MRLRISEIKDKELSECLELVHKTFMRYDAPLFTDEGISSFMRFASYDNISYLMDKRSIKFYKAVFKGKLIGAAAIKNLSHISLLFVDEEHQRNGAGTSLLNFCIKVIRRKNKYACKVTLNSSPASYEFYLKFGFNFDSDEKISGGVIYTPMSYAL